VRILVTGATGLIGSAVVARLIGAGHAVTALSRSVATARRRQPEAEWLSLDIARQVTAEHWVPHLQGIESVVNCAGALQDGPSDSLKGVHAVGISALFAACEQLGIRRVVHFSAIGVDRATPTAFSRTKLEGDQALMARDLDWVVLRPSVVLGRATYGASALMRALAALPVLPLLPNTGPLQVVQLDEVVQTVLFFLKRDAPARVALEIAGPERLSFADVVLHYRRWRGDKPPPIIHLPEWAARLIYLMGDLTGLLGWRPRDRARRGRRSGTLVAHDRHRSALLVGSARRRADLGAGALVRTTVSLEAIHLYDLRRLLDRHRRPVGRPEL
jgi:uncharacterized protein YbjT (DUF2867 family)